VLLDLVVLKNPSVIIYNILISMKRYTWYNNNYRCNVTRCVEYLVIGEYQQLDILLNNLHLYVNVFFFLNTTDNNDSSVEMKSVTNVSRLRVTTSLVI
jgi:hypothetical protein